MDRIGTRSVGGVDDPFVGSCDPVSEFELLGAGVHLYCTATSPYCTTLNYELHSRPWPGLYTHPYSVFHQTWYSSIAELA